MRRKDREIRDMDRIMKILSRETVCSVAFHDEPCPYLIPMNYGAVMENGVITLYFHGASEGTKLELLQKNPQVSFSVVSGADVRLVCDEPCRSACGFESVCGSGLAEIAKPSEKKKGLTALMNQIGRPHGKTFDGQVFPDAAVNGITVWKITVDRITGKRHE